MRFVIFFFMLMAVVSLQAQQQLVLLNSPTNKSLRGIDVVNDSVWWVSGRNNTVIKTNDGGKTWTTFLVGDTSLKTDYRDIEVLEDGSVLAMGITRPAVIYRLPNGGGQWEQTFLSADTNVFLDAMDFWDSKTGRCLADPMEGYWPLLATMDGGKNWFWQSTESTPKAGVGEAAFAASGNTIRLFGDSEIVFVTGGLTNSKMYQSFDRGEHWNTSTSVVSGSASSGLFCAEKLDEQHFVAVGGDFNEPEKKANTIDFFPGNQATKSGLNGYRCAVKKVGTTALIATGDGGTDISNDLGKSWQTLSSEGFYTFDCAGNTCVFAGKGGKIGLMHIAAGQ